MFGYLPWIIRIAGFPFLYFLFDFPKYHSILGVFWCLLGILIFPLVEVMFHDWSKGRWSKRHMVLVVSYVFLMFGGLFQNQFWFFVLLAVIFWGGYLYLGGQVMLNAKSYERAKEKEVNDSLDSEAEKKVKNLIEFLKTNGKIVPGQVEDLTDFPCADYLELSRKIESGELIIWKLSMIYNETLFFLFAYPFEKFLTYLKLFFQFVVPILGSFYLAFFISWWFLFGIFSVPIFAMAVVPFGKRIYTNVILRSAHKSELFFCLLWSFGEIGLKEAKGENFWMKK